MLRIAPSELLDDLEAERLRTLRVIRPQVDVHESPAVPVGHLRAQPVYIVVVAVDRENGRVEDRRAQDLPGLEAVGNEHAAFDAKARGVSRDAVREVPGRRAGENLESKLHRSRRSDGYDAIFVRQRRVIHRIVLDVELVDAEPIGKLIAADQRREARVEPRARFAGDRQQLAVPPQILRPPLDLLARQRDRAVVVHRLERSETFVADIRGFRRKRRLTEMTLQTDQCAHTASASLKSALRTGDGTMAALSRAMAARSLRIATAVASPPAPMPKMPVSPECSPVMSAALSVPPVSSICDSTALVVPFRMATMRVMRSPARPSPMARTIGIAPPTAPSNRSWRPWRAAKLRSGAPSRAMTCLFAVTTDLPAASAARIHSAAGSRPPIASTMTSASLWSTSSTRSVQAMFRSATATADWSRAAPA